MGCAVALFAGGESTCAAAGRPWDCRSRPMALTEEKGEGEDAAGEGVPVTPGAPQEIDPL